MIVTAMLDRHLLQRMPAVFLVIAVLGFSVHVDVFRLSECFRTAAHVCMMHTSSKSQ